MKVSDVFLECKNVLGYGDEATIFSRLSDAVEALCNKGLVDAMQGYLEISAVNRLVTLPRDCETPIKVNISNNPSFSRTKLFEFTLNGPGSDYTPTDWSWEDRGTIPVLVQPVTAELVNTSSNSADNGKKIYVWGRNSLGQEINGSVTLLGTGNPYVADSNGTQLAFTSITRVIKDPTTWSVTLRSASTVPLVLSTYAPDETEPAYRQIRISEDAASCHILFRRSVYRVSSQNDWIPIQSRMGLFLMLRANEFFRKATAADIQTAQALEKQAEQFVNEEQKSRNMFAEVASQTEKDSAKGIYFSNRDSIIVADIYDEAAEICGPIGESRLYDRISESIEALANKAQWDAMTSYIDITVASGNIVVLPREVEVPIKVNINGDPSFSRDRLYEFTLNGPASTMTESTDFSWMDQGNVPITGELVTPDKVQAIASDASDNGLEMTIYGKLADGTEYHEVIEINTSPTLSTGTFASISRIVKDVTKGVVTLTTQVAVILGYYYQDDIDPTYRRIRLSKDAAAVRIMFRKASMRVSSMNDLIPLSSRAAITCMMRSFEAYRSKEQNGAQMSKMLEDKAVALLLDEQKSRNVFSQFTDKEKHPIVGLNINNRDSIIVSDIYDDACDIAGMIGRGAVFDELTSAIEMLSTKGQWEGNGLEGYVDITAASGLITLPRYVDYILSMNIGNRPSQMRGKWFEFHLNGPGIECSQACRTWTDLGDVVTLADLTEEQGVVYVPDSSADNGKTVRVYGYDEDDKWIVTNGVDGFSVTGDSTYTFANISSQKVKRIERITRESTAGFATLTAYNSTGVTSTILGYYYPDETEPNYRRIKVPDSACWIRMRYRKRQLLIDSLTDPLHLRSRLAILAALSSITSLKKGDLAAAEQFEKKAIDYLSAEKTSRNPNQVFKLQFSTATSMASPEHAQY